MSLLKKAKSFASAPRRIKTATRDDIELVIAYCQGEISLKQVNHAWGDKSMSATNTKIFYVMRKIISENK